MSSAIHGHDDDFLYKEGERTADIIGTSMASAIDDVLYTEWKRTAQEGSPMSAVHGHDDDFVYELQHPLKTKGSLFWFSSLVQKLKIKWGRKS